MIGVRSFLRRCYKSMEAFANDVASEFDFLGLTTNYDPTTNSFDGGGVPVRHVTERRIPAFDAETNSFSDTKFDTFSGIIDGITGYPLHGTRIYTITGEVYEGKFSQGKRHGDSAIVNHINLPKVAPQLPQESSELGINQHQFTNLSFRKANFFGQYANDEPVYGILVTDSFSYRGPFVNGTFSGIRGELIHSSGYTYLGEFQHGCFHGMGREIIPKKGEYQGEFRNGMKHGMGTFKEYLDGDDEKSELPAEEAQETIQMKVNALFSTKIKEQDWDSHDYEVAKPEAHPKRYTYSGFYHGNLRQGEGTEWTPNGEAFTGQFLADRRHGHGILKKDDITYEGKWRAGLPIDGNGWRILFGNGDSYQGHTFHYELDGYGIYTHSNGDVYSGEWRKGQRHGNGIQSDIQGSEFSGEWKDDVQVSRKRLEATDGTLSAIAQTLRITDHAAAKSEEETGKASDAPKHEQQLSFLKQAMSKSIETSLRIIAQQQHIEEEIECKAFQEKPQTRRSRSKSREDRRAELHTYANGDTYLGALDPDTLQRTGYGVYVSKCTGCTYTGQFRKNLRHGYGILIHSQFGKYAGDFVDDKKHGSGTLILSDATSYHGGFANGNFHGKGTLCERNGAVYVGEWKSGLRDGEGMETTPNGRVYKGHFLHGMREGNGTLLERTGGKIIYTGDWRDGKYHGEGSLVKRSLLNACMNELQLKFEGSFSDGQKHGYGVCTLGEVVCKGVWSHDVPVSGKWRISYMDGSIYTGQARVVDGGAIGNNQVVAVPDGFGTMKYSNNDVFAGYFDYGIRSGDGTCLFANGDKWEGAWRNDQIDKKGNGALTLANGQVHNFSENSMGNILSRSEQRLQQVIDKAGKHMKSAVG